MQGVASTAGDNAQDAAASAGGAAQSAADSASKGADSAADAAGSAGEQAGEAARGFVAGEWPSQTLQRGFGVENRKPRALILDHSSTRPS